MLKQHLAYRTYKNSSHEEIYLYVYKFDYEISKTANEITEILKAVKEVVSSQ